VGRGDLGLSMCVVQGVCNSWKDLEIYWNLKTLLEILEISLNIMVLLEIFV